VTAIDDPLMHQTGPDVFWTTVNAAEARPGVSTPLSQSFWGNAAELGARRAFFDLGVIPRSMVRVGPPDENISAVFYGRCAANVDTLRRIADRTPGMSGDGLERQLLGATRPGIPSCPSPGRIPFVAAKAPVVVARSAAMIRRAAPEYERWWRERTHAPGGATAGHLNEAVRRFEVALWMQLRVTFVAQGLFDKLSRVAERAGRPGLERELVSGYGTLPESGMARDLHAAAQGQLALGEFTRRWGYHGPREGELMSRSWRESTTALHRTLMAQATAQHPDLVAVRQAATRRAAQGELLGALPRGARSSVALLLRLVRTYVPLREVGKAMYVQAIDAGRAAARSIGADWNARGFLADPEDVFFLTIPELGRRPGRWAAETTAARRARHAEYERLDLPLAWKGKPEPIPLGARLTPDRNHLEGIGVAGGDPVEGRARVIIDSATDDPVEPGEILVCQTTDPSWVAVFMCAAALVIDIGGPLSHGAIVARELGIPAVVNTVDGTRTIRTGDRIRVDGTTGVVEILERRPSP
jgi:phosphohistidine swiveling domain-containing protein